MQVHFPFHHNLKLKPTTSFNRLTLWPQGIRSAGGAAAARGKHAPRRLQPAGGVGGEAGEGGLGLGVGEGGRACG